ncbi:uncharacterized protein LOC136091560 [Hydra vulgaris]|uniref:Uncharacterized protein LOC136091560 n=1 Tax=Hydra vulgaris TaxID=6087 RepID=A0ABM4DLA8_HYDVU
MHNSQFVKDDSLLQVKRSMLNNKNAICRYHYKDSVEYINSSFLISCYIINALFTLVTNGFLILGLHITNKNKKFTRNEKLVFILSISDILNALIVSPSQIILLKLIDSLGCFEISIITFFRVWLLGLSGTIFILISCERYLTVFYNNKICGVIIKDSYLFRYLLFVMSFTFTMAVLYSVVYITLSMHLHFIIFIGTGCFTLALLSMIVIINLLMLIQTKRKWKTNSIRVQKNIKIKNYITKTVVIISLTHVIFYAPCLITQYYLSFVYSKNDIFQIPAVIQVLLWTVVVREASSWINALVYALRNRKISKIIGSRISLLLSNFNQMARPIQEVSSDNRSTSAM